MRFATRAIHEGNPPDPETGAVSVPIYQTSTYVQKRPGEHQGYEYSRTDNPTRRRLEENLASLAGAGGAVAFASGMAAVDTVMNLLDSGDHVVAGEDLYGGTYRLFEELYRDYDIDFTYVEATDPAAVVQAQEPNTRLIWLETPTNPLLRIVDIEAVTERAREDVLVAVDNTFASPYLQRPLERGADLTVHSTTKYLGGHSDLVGGAVCGQDESLIEELRFYQNAAGAVPGPTDCFLTLRGTKTLAVRMDQHCENAAGVARYLHDHPTVKRVYYPGLESHPGHQVARDQMDDFGGMVSAELEAGVEETAEALGEMEVFHLAESLGGVESLIEHPASMTHASIPAERRREAGLTDGLIRLSVGIEDQEDLLDDLRELLDRVR